MVFLPSKGRKGFFLLSVAISWMGAWHPPYFCSTELYRFLGGNGQFSPTKFQTTFFQQKNNWKTNWNILQPSKHPGAARFLSSKPQPFCCARANTSSMAPVHLALGVLVEPKRSDSRHLGEMSISAKSSNQGFCLWSPLLKTEPGTEPRNNDSPETSKTRVTGVV